MAELSGQCSQVGVLPGQDSALVSTMGKGDRSLVYSNISLHELEDVTLKYISTY
jgi:hypothetical protein